MDSVKEKTIQKFAALGVKREDIFKEIMRARRLDYEIFSKAENAKYGLSQEELREAAERLTAERFGHVPEDPEKYAYMYSLALSVDPMLFAEGTAPATAAVNGLVSYAISRAGRAGCRTVLFAGAEKYLLRLTDIFMALRHQRIAVMLADPAWKEPVAMIYSRGRSMLASDIDSDAERYDYIFYVGEEGLAGAALWGRLHDRLSEGGEMDALLPDSLLRSEAGDVQALFRKRAGECRISRLCHVVDGEIEKDLITSGKREPEGKITFGEAVFGEEGFQSVDCLAMGRTDFQAADSWDYDLYAYNGNASIQTILSAGLLDPDFSLGNVYKEVRPLSGTMGTYTVIPAEAVETAGVREDLVKEEVISDVKRVEAGDLLLTVRDGHLFCAPLPESLAGSAAAPGIWVLRPIDVYTAEYAKVFLDGPIGQLFQSVTKTAKGTHMCASRLLRIPLRRASEERIGIITDLVRRTTKRLAGAEADWREVKRDAVGLMMGPEK